MHARRPGQRFNRGRVANNVLVSPLNIIGAANTVAWYRSDLGVTIATGVSQWNDQTANGFHLTQGTGANQPAYSTSAGPNGTPELTFDGTNDFMANATINLPAPATTPTTFWFIFRQITASVAARQFGCDAAENITLYTPGGGNQFTMFNGANGPINNGIATGGNHGRAEIYFSGSANDYSRFKANLVTGPTSNNNDPGAGFTLGDRNLGGTPSNIGVVELAIFNKLLTAAEVSALNAYGIARYGSAVFS